MTSKEVREFVVFTQTEPVEHILDMTHPHDTLPIGIEEMSDEEAGHLGQASLHLEPGEELWCECEFTGDDDPHLT
jgi:hypothetical protein